MSGAIRHAHSLRTIEDVEVHWGMTIDLRTECMYCGLQLAHANMNVTVFQCGEYQLYFKCMFNYSLLTVVYTRRQ